MLLQEFKMSLQNQEFLKTQKEDLIYDRGKVVEVLKGNRGIDTLPIWIRQEILTILKKWDDIFSQEIEQVENDINLNFEETIGTLQDDL